MSITPSVRLKYGKGEIEADFPEGFVPAILTGAELTAIPGNRLAEELRKSIEQPIGLHQPLKEILSEKKKILIVLSDPTREVGYGLFLGHLLGLLKDWVIQKSAIRLIVATGLHNAPSQDELRACLGKEAFDHEILIHNADGEENVPAGKTSSGIKVLINRAVYDSDFLLLTGSIGFHYRAGFSGGRKALVPGLAGRETIESIHKKALSDWGGEDLRVSPGNLADNPVHREFFEAASLFKPDFLINTVTDGSGKILKFFSGDFSYAHRSGVEFVASNFLVRLEERFPVVVADGGGWPWDRNLYQANKALQAASRCCNDNGTIILVAECAEGLGSSRFFEYMETPDLPALEKLVRERYSVPGNTLLSMRGKLEKYRVYLVSRLHYRDAVGCDFIPTASVEEALLMAYPEGTEESVNVGVLSNPQLFLPVWIPDEMRLLRDRRVGMPDRRHEKVERRSGEKERRLSKQNLR